MIRNPILKVLSTIRKHRVQALLMGGQACIFYGAAEFSRDTDFAVLSSRENLDRLRAALDELGAEVIAVPPFSIDVLERGHAVHFRCRHPDAQGIRVDVMSVLRGVDAFDALWERRTTVNGPGGETHELLSLPDLVQAKKTQRDKDWPMIRRLLEAHYFEHRAAPTEDHVRFWCRELRTPELLVELAQGHPAVVSDEEPARPLLIHALAGDMDALGQALRDEEDREREADRRYWQPLRQELEQLRRERRRDPS